MVPKASGQDDEQVAAIVALPVLQDMVGCLAQLLRLGVGECGKYHRQFMRVGAERLQIRVHRQQHVGGSGEGFGPMPSFSASTHQRCQRKLWRRRVPKSEMLQVRQERAAARSWPIAWPWRGHRARRAQRGRRRFIAARERSSLMMASAGISHSEVYIHGPWKLELVLPIALRQLIFRQAEIRRARPKTPARRSACVRRRCCRRARSSPSWRSAACARGRAGRAVPARRFRRRA